MSPALKHFLAILSLIAVVYSGLLWADEVALKPDHPERYTVVKGDTLWDIANRFLKSPWLWAKVWKINEQIENPHLIYPGDIIVLRWEDGKPVLGVERPIAARQPPSGDERIPIVEGQEPMIERTVDGYRMLPRVRITPREDPIPTIPPDAIGPFLTRPLVVGSRELRSAGYVTIGVDDRRALGDLSEFYARGLRRKGRDNEYFSIIRKGKALRDPKSRRLLGYEAIYLGEAKVLRPGNPALMRVIKVTQEILPTDRLVPSERTPPVPYYFPHPPKRKVKGTIVHAHNSVSEMGPLTVVAINLGRRDGMEPGHVLSVYFSAGYRIDPVNKRSYRIPNEQAGLMMVFRTFEKISYGLIMSASRPIKIADIVTNP